MSSKFGDQNAIQALITNNQRVKFYNNATGSFVQLPNPVSFTAQDYAVKGNIWVKSDNAYLTDTDINFYVAANNGNRGNSQPCSTQSIHVPTSSVFDNTGGNIYVTAGGSTYITDSVLKSHNRDATLTPTTIWNITGGGACHYQYDIAGSEPLSNFPNSAIGTSGAPAHLQLFHDGSLDANGHPNPCTFNYTLMTQPDGLITGPVASSVNVIPSASSLVTEGGTSYSVFGNYSTIGIVTAVVLIVGGFTVKYIVPKALDSYFEREIHDPLELAIMQNMNKRLTLATNWCDWNSKDKKDKFGAAVHSVISNMATLGIQTRTDLVLKPASCSGCCGRDAADKKVANESIMANASAGSAGALAIDNKASDTSANVPAKEKLLDQLDINALAKIVVTQIKKVCIPKRKCCARCKDRCCSCKRDVEDTTIAERSLEIAQAVFEDLKMRRSHLIKNQDAIDVPDFSKSPQLQLMLKEIKDEQSRIKAMLNESTEVQREIAARAVSIIHYNNQITRVHFGRNNFGARKFSNDLRVIGYEPRLNLIDSTKNVASAVVGVASAVVGVVGVDVPTPSMLRPEKDSIICNLIETEERRWVVELSTPNFTAKGKPYLVSKDYEIMDEHDEAIPAPPIKQRTAAPLPTPAMPSDSKEAIPGNRKKSAEADNASAIPAPLPLPSAVVTVNSAGSGGSVELAQLAGVSVIDIPQPSSSPAAASPSSTGQLLMPRSFNSSSTPVHTAPPPVLTFSSAATNAASATTVDGEWAPPPPPPPAEPSILAFSSAATLAATAGGGNGSAIASTADVHLTINPNGSFS